MGNGSEEARKIALVMGSGATLSALLALAFWTDVFGLGLEDTQRQMLTAVFVVACISEAVLARVFYLRKMAGK
jgi:hypothetical protein